jgi:hypothetical protein
LDGSIDNLSNDSSVGSSYNKSVFLGVILVLILLDESSSGVVISLSFSSSSVLDLESLEVSLVLYGLNECHFMFVYRVLIY